MCKPVAEGGQRCAAHTRPAYEAATPGTPEWDDAAAAYASTPTGSRELQEDLVRADEAHLKALSDASAIREWVKAEHHQWTKEDAEAEQVNADGHMRTAQGLENALKRGAALRERNTEVKTAIQLLTPNRQPDTRAAMAAVERDSEGSRQVREERQRQAEEVIFLINHGYTADAKHEMRSYKEQFGNPVFDALPAEPMPRFGKRKQAAVKEQEERRIHAEKVLLLIDLNDEVEARLEAARFAKRFGTSYDPKMAASMSGRGR